MTTISINQLKEHCIDLFRSSQEADFCVCCLSQRVRLITLVSCKHFALLIGISGFVVENRVQYICIGCHNFLVKFSLFCKQVEQNVRWLQSSVFHQKPVNKVFNLQCTPVKTTTFSPEIDNPIQIDAIKVETDFDFKPDYDFDQLKGEFAGSDLELDLKEDLTSHEVDVPSHVEVTSHSHVKNEVIEQKVCGEGNFVGNSGAKTLPPREPNRLEVLTSYDGIVYRVKITPQELEAERQIQRQSEFYMKKAFKCTDCILGFNYKERLDEHNEARHTIKPFSVVCDICKCVLNVNTIKQHVLRHWTRYRCEKCPYHSKDLHSTLKHYNHSHERLPEENKQYQCRHCSYVTSSNRSYRYHLEKHKNSKCKSCSKTFTTASSLKTHLENVHKRIPEGVKCKVCHKSYKNRHSLIIHEKRHRLVSAPAYCVSCKKMYKSSETLKSHLARCKVHAQDSNVKRYICDHCKESFIYKSTLRSHILGTHFPEAMIKCPICNKSLRGSLERHIEYVHNKKQAPKNYICDYCGRACSSSTLLRIHIRVHTGERPLSCPDCGATFAHPAALYTHKRLKHGKKPKRLET